MPWSSDTFLDGQLRVSQSVGGYRFSIDAVILAHHALPGKPKARLLDLGTGCGIIPLLMAHRYPQVHITGVEIQSELAALARKNVTDNGFQSRITIVEGDFQQVQSYNMGAPMDLVISNPPYRKLKSGRINPQNQCALARHEIATSLDGLIKAMRRFLYTGGSGWLVYPVERLAELMIGMQSHHMEPKYLRMIHSNRDSEAMRCLLKVVKAARPGLRVDAPLVIHNRDGQFVEEVAAMFRP